MLRSCAQDSLKKLVCDTPSTGLDVQALVLEHDCPLQGGCEIDCKVSIKAAPECTAVHIGQTGRPVNMHFSLHWSMTELMQAAQVRKNGYVPEPDVNYQPDVHNYCSVYAGTMVQQVPSFSACSACLVRTPAK